MEVRSDDLGNSLLISWLAGRQTPLVFKIFKACQVSSTYLATLNEVIIVSVVQIELYLVLCVGDCLIKDCFSRHINLEAIH